MTRPTSLNIGYDGEVIDRILDVHCPNFTNILDITWGEGGKIWKHSRHAPCIRTDLKPTGDVIANFLSLPFRSQSWDVVVWDPPHISANACTEHASKFYEQKYGIVADNPLIKGDNVNGVWTALPEINRLLTRDGVLLVKIADQVHNHKYQWQHVELINTASQLGMCACDLVINAHPAASNLTSTKWQNVFHMRRAHVYWVVIRPVGAGCERRKSA